MTPKPFQLHFLSQGVVEELRGRNAAAIERYWYPINQIGWELRCLLRDSGFVASLPKKLRAITIKWIYDTFYGFDPDLPDLQDKKQINVYVHLNATEYDGTPPDEYRYWPEKAVMLDALSHVAGILNMPEAVKAQLQHERARCPTSPPYPPLPPFDIADVERDYEARKSPPIVADANGRIRAMRSLEPGEGILWIMFGAIQDSNDETIDRLQGDLQEFFTKKGLGQWEGDSRNGPVSDISFEVGNLAQSARAVRKFLNDNWPLLNYVIADEYDPAVFERLG